MDKTPLKAAQDMLLECSGPNCTVSRCRVARELLHVDLENSDLRYTLYKMLTTMPSVALDVVIAHARELVKDKEQE